MPKSRSTIDRAAVRRRVQLLRRHYTARELAAAFHLSAATEGKTLRRWASGERLPSPKNRDRINRLVRKLERMSGWFRDPAGSVEDAEDDVAVVVAMLEEYLRTARTQKERESALFRWIEDSVQEEAGTSRASWSWREFIGRGDPPRDLIRVMNGQRFAFAAAFAFVDRVGTLYAVAVAAALLDLRTFERCLTELLLSATKGKPNVRSPALRTQLEIFRDGVRDRIGKLKEATR